MVLRIRALFPMLLSACVDGTDPKERDSGEPASEVSVGDDGAGDNGSTDTHGTSGGDTSGGDTSATDTSDPSDSGDSGGSGTDDTGLEPLDHEVCDNGFDDDWNGAADCVDPACATVGTCSCIDQDVGTLVGTLWTGSISGMGDDTQGPCTTNTGGEDIQLTWTPPEDGCFELTTSGSSFDTTLAVGQAWCGGEMFACNDDTDGVQSSVTVSARAGRSMLVVAEAYDEFTSGNLQLVVQSGEAFSETDDADLGSAVGSAVQTGVLSSASASIHHACADVTGASSVVRWEAPSTGTWSFTTTGSDFDAALTVFGQCATALTCDDYRAGDGQADARVLLAEGDIVHLAIGGVDGETGTWVLNVAGPE
jgi:hypothetical protein